MSRQVMPVDFRRERAWWDAKAPAEELDLLDEAVNRALRWREIERRLRGVETILEIGGATGAFSIPLAQRGYAVTHVDFSSAMLDIAREKAGDADGLCLVQANAVALPFPDRAFDLALNMDGAVSFCGDLAEQAIREACRVTGRVLILSVSHRASLIAGWVEQSAKVCGRLTPAVYEMFDRGRWHQDQFPDNARLTRGGTQDYLGVHKAFLPGELRAILESAGMRVLRCGGIGTLANLCGMEAVEWLRADADAYAAFLDLCERYDLEILPDGPGTWRRAGLIAVAAPATEAI